MKKLGLFFIFIFFSLCSKEPYYLTWDIDFSSYSGSEDILTFHQCLEYVSDRIFKSDKENRFLGLIKRLSGMTFVWYPLSEYEITLDHEVFGHGYRIRDLGSNVATVTKYNIHAPFPYGDGGGSTYYVIDNLTSFLETSISVAGVEATAILANRLKLKWMRDLKIDARKLFLYLDSQHDLTQYVYTMDDFDVFEDDGHDIESYLFWLNNTYYQDNLSKKDIKNAVLINLIDPTTYFCIGAFFYYIYSGKELRIPTINIKKLKMLPNLRLGLAPYGIEYYLENFMSYDNNPIYSYFRIGKHNQNTFWGFGLEYFNLFKTDLYKIGCRFDFYRQPIIYFEGGKYEVENIQFGYSDEDLNKMIYGVSSSIIVEKSFKKKPEVSLYLEGGYKTNGFVQGQSLRNSFILRLGLGFNSF